ncbi:MAG: glycoside hydrolase family 3 protein [Deltaproteobacteria bacterium]|nr:glycoside hydrolase family 3 protein [Deltaproteobacteria bacterium]
MKTMQFKLPMAVSLLCGMLACSGGEEPMDGGSDGGVDAGWDGGSTDVDAGDVDSGLSEECNKPANLARIQALQAAQPELEVRTRDILTVTSTFASLADDPSEICSVALRFKDSNGSGAVEPYEDWTRTAEARAADLVARMTRAEKVGLVLHPTLSDVPSGQGELSTALTQDITDKHVRFGATEAGAAPLTARAFWANNIQALAEGEPHGIPFVLSVGPSHSTGNGRTKATGFSQWPAELGLGATGDLSMIEGFGGVVSQELRAVGVRMLRDVSADLATEPRWYGAQFTFGEDSGQVADRVAAFVRGLQGETLDASGVAAVLGHFPGAGAATDGWDARLEKGKFTVYPGAAFDQHVAAFAKALDVGAAAVMPGYGVPAQGAWSGAGGIIDGATTEQVGAAFHAGLVTDLLRGHLGFGGLVVAPWGVLEAPGLSPLGTPWGVEALTPTERLVKAMNAGVDQLGGLGDPAVVEAALDAGDVSGARLDAAAARALAVMFELGLFEDPYVDPEQAPALANTDTAYRAGLRAMDKSMVLLKNAQKPANWLNGNGDGTQTGDKGNAGNGTMKVLPAPPGEPYVAAGCSYFIMGNFDLDYVRSVSAGYGLLTNDVFSINDVPVETPEERMAMSDYIFIRIDAPFTADPDSGDLGLTTEDLEYAEADNVEQLNFVRAARQAIDAWTGTVPSQAQIVVIVDGGRPSVLEEVLNLGVSALYVSWYGTMPSNLYADKVALDVAFGIVDGEGKLPVGIPASNVAARAQSEDVAGDGQDSTFVRGFGLETPSFE